MSHKIKRIPPAVAAVLALGFTIASAEAAAPGAHMVMRERLESTTVVKSEVSRPVVGGGTEVSRTVQSPGRLGAITMKEMRAPGGNVTQFRAAVANRLVVQLGEGADETRLAALVAANGWRIARYHGLGFYSVEVEETDFDGLEAAAARLNAAGAGAVASVSPDNIAFQSRIPNDPQFRRLWGMQNTGQTGGTPGADIGAASVWDRTTSGTGVTVAVIDSGVDWRHPDLTNNIVAGGYDFYEYDEDPSDEDGHGTHCAGTIGAEGNNAIGVAGVCWDARILPLRFLGPNGLGSMAASAEAVIYAVDNGAKVLSCSYGSIVSDPIERAAVTYAEANGVLMIASAGNDGLDNDTVPHYPASYSLTHSNVIAVAASDFSDFNAGFSNYGANSVHLHAPGVDIYSTRPGGGYQSMDGTSMATPLVAGSATLLWSSFPSASAGEIKEALLKGTDKPRNLAGKTITGGRLSLRGAFSRMDPHCLLDSSAAEVTAEAGSYTIEVDANVAWTASCPAAWVSVSPSSGTGSETITVSYGMNSALADRSAVITVSGSGVAALTHTLTQAAPALEVSASEITIMSQTNLFPIAVEASVGWTVSGVPAWMSVDPMSGSGSAVLTFTCEENVSPSARTALITFTGSVGGLVRTIDITQCGAGFIPPATNPNLPQITNCPALYPSAAFAKMDTGRKPGRVFATQSFIYETEWNGTAMRVHKRDNTGVLVRKFTGGPNATDLTNWSEARADGITQFATLSGLAKHPAENLIAVADKGVMAQRVVFYSFTESAGAVTFAYVGKIATNVSDPTDVAFGADGSVYISGADGNVRYVTKYTGPYAAMQWAGDILFEEGPNSYDGLDIDHVSGNILVSSSSDNAVYEVSPAGALIRTYGIPGVSGIAGGRLTMPTDATVWRRPSMLPKVLIADTGNNRISIFNLDGSFLASISSFGKGWGQLSGPRSVFADHEIIVTDTQNQRLQIFLPDFGNTDTDGDGIPDWWAVDNGYLPPADYRTVEYFLYDMQPIPAVFPEGAIVTLQAKLGFPVLNRSVFDLKLTGSETDKAKFVFSPVVFESGSDTATFTVQFLDGPGTTDFAIVNNFKWYFETYQTLTATNVPPTIANVQHGFVYVGKYAKFNVLWTDPAGTYDQPYVKMWSFDGTSFNSIPDDTFKFDVVGETTVYVRVFDKDGGYDEYSFTVDVLPKEVEYFLFYNQPIPDIFPEGTFDILQIVLECPVDEDTVFGFEKTGDTDKIDFIDSFTLLAGEDTFFFPVDFLDGPAPLTFALTNDAAFYNVTYQTLNVTNLPPVITGIGRPADALANDPAEFRITFTDPAGVYDEPFEILWTFNDGTPNGYEETITGETITNSFEAAGTVYGTVRVTDKDGDYDEWTFSFTVEKGEDDPGDPEDPEDPEDSPIVFTAITVTNATFRIPAEMRKLEFTVQAVPELLQSGTPWDDYDWLDVDPTNDGSFSLNSNPIPDMTSTDVQVDVETGVPDDSVVYITFETVSFNGVSSNRFFRVKTEVP